MRTSKDLESPEVIKILADYIHLKKEFADGLKAKRIEMVEGRIPPDEFYSYQEIQADRMINCDERRRFDELYPGPEDAEDYEPAFLDVYGEMFGRIYFGKKDD